MEFSAGNIRLTSGKGGDGGGDEGRPQKRNGSRRLALGERGHREY